MPHSFDSPSARASSWSKSNIRSGSGDPGGNLVRRVTEYLRSPTVEGAKELYAWFQAQFPQVFMSRTPRGQKSLKTDAEFFASGLKLAGYDPLEGSRGSPDWEKVVAGRAAEVGKRWDRLKDHVDDLVAYFSIQSSRGVEIPSEVKVGQNLYKNLAGLPGSKLNKYVSEMEKLWSSVTGWRRKAFKGGITVAFAGAREFRGTASGVYRTEKDTLMVRATPKVLSRAPGYGSPQYVLVHELGHRYERFNTLPKNFDSAEWTTTRYSTKEGEAFAELFALSHFDLRGNWDPSKVSRFDGLMSGRDRTARREVFDIKKIEKFRKDFLMLMKNVKSLRDYDQAWKWKRYVKKWTNDFEEYVRKNLAGDTITNLGFSEKIRKADADYWKSRVLKETWDLIMEFGSGHSINSMEYVRKYKWGPSATKEQVFHDFMREVPKWEGRVRRGSRKAWKVLKEFVEWYEGVIQEKVTVDVPVEERVNIEGFQVLVTGFPDPSSADRLYWGALERFKAGLGLYRKRAAKVLPLLLRSQLPIVLDFKASIDEGGEYRKNRIMINPHAGENNPGQMARVIAHEMGHHIYKNYISGDDQEFWKKAITGNYGTLDLYDVLARYGSEKFLYGNERIKRENPILYLQIAGLYNDNEYKYTIGKLLTMDEVRDFLSGGGESKYRVHGKPITGYAHKDDEEAFCDAIGMLVGYGPRTVLPEVRSWLQTILPQIKIASLDPARVASRYLLADAKDGKTTGDRSGVWIGFRLPKHLADQFPSLGDEDKSPPHVTFLYVGKVSPTQDMVLVDTARGVFSSDVSAFRARLDGLDHFTHPDKGRRVAHCPVRFNRPLSEIRDRLKFSLEDAGVEVADSFPVYRPHVTLAYMDGLQSEYGGTVPRGDWDIDEVEIWGLPMEYHVKFKSGSVPSSKSAREEKIPGGLAKGKKPSDFDQEQLSKGIKVEMEHTDDSSVAEEIAMDHLMEDPKYYDKLETIEKHALDPDTLARAYVIKTASYFNEGDVVLFGKYKNKKGIIVGFGQTEKGDPTVEIEPIPKGRKQNKVLNVFKIRHADPEKRS